MSRGKSAIAAMSLALLAGCAGSSRSSFGSNPKGVPSEPTNGPTSSSPTPSPTNGPTSSSPTPSSTPSAASAATNIKLLMTHLVNQDSSVVAKGAAYAAPGSPAARYVPYRAVRNATDIANANVPPPASVVRTGSTYSVCETATGPRRCLAFTHFVVSPAGKVVSFSTAGESITTRLVTSGAKGGAEGLTAVLTSGYRSGEGQSVLYLLFTVGNGSRANVNAISSQATYQGQTE